MPKKKPGMSPEEQSESFRAKVREMIAFERTVKAARTKQGGS
jgi:hypothetical protein